MPCTPRDHLCFACDEYMNLGEAARMVVELSDYVGTIKFNSAFVKFHTPLVTIAGDLGVKIWVDLKVKDIPETVHWIIQALDEIGIDYTTIDLTGGSEMIRAALRIAGAMKILGSTVLTTMNEQMFREELGIPRSIREEVLRLAYFGKIHGVHGIVCSGQEVAAVRQACGSNLELVTPGIRFAEGDVHDQKRVVTPGEAIRRGSDLIVMGRELLQGGVDAAQRALAEIEGALAEKGAIR